MTTRNPWSGPISKAAVLSTARRIESREGLIWRQALRRALAWAKRKADGNSGQAPADEFAALRARGIYSPRDKSPEAERHFAEHRRRFPGRGYGPQTEGR